MTDKTVFQGTFAKIQQVSGRKVTQFIIEVPTEAANHALQCLADCLCPTRRYGYAWLAWRTNRE